MCDEADFAAAEGGLDRIAKSVGRSDHRKGRSERFRWQRHAAGLLEGKARVGLCRWSVISKSAGVDWVVSRYANGERRAHYEGVQTCGSIWACPCCGARISETRRGEVNEALAWARENGLTVKMVTFTARHGADDPLDELLDGMKVAKRRLHQHRVWKRMKAKIVGSITATEVTGGGMAGWHPHFHVILICEEGVDLSDLCDAWLASLRGAGLDGTGQGFRIDDASAAGAYMAKWGAGEEVTLSDRKSGRRSGRTPAQLLADSCDAKDREAGLLWREYAETFHGRRQLVWSRGLKALVGIGEVDDAEAAQDARQDDQEEADRGNLTHTDWTGCARAKRAVVLDAAEMGGAEAVRAAIEGPRSSRDLACPPPMRPGGLAYRALVAAWSSEPDKSGGRPPAPPPSRSVAPCSSGGAGGGVGPVQREGTGPERGLGAQPQPSETERLF